MNRRNVIIVLMAIELMLLAVNMTSSRSRTSWATPPARSFVFFILTVAAAEAGSASRSWWRCSATSKRSTSRISTSSRAKDDGA